MAQRKAQSLRHRAPLDDADDLDETCVKNMEQEKAAILGRKLRNIRSEDQHFLNACMYATNSQKKMSSWCLGIRRGAFIERLTQVSHTVVNHFSIFGVQVQ